jgi:dissimilatory sulfite reductase (desulfoviridin) alpha/beta subunit
MFCRMVISLLCCIVQNVGLQKAKYSTDKCCGCVCCFEFMEMAIQEGIESGTIIYVIDQRYHQLKKNLSNIG